MGAEGNEPAARERLLQWRQVLQQRLREAINHDVETSRRARRWWRHRQQEHPASLFTASAVAIAVLAAFAVVLWLVLGRALGDDWPWELLKPDTSRYTVARMVLFVLAGAVGVIGIVVAYRRQRGHEQGRFLEQLAEGSRLLGDPNPTVQAAGIYALAGLADSETRERRQQCVDVLCAYIRLPYAPAPGGPPDALETVVRTRTRRTRTGPVEELSTVFRPHDRHTRETIIRVITAHLQLDAKVSWSDLDFDFTGAVFDYGDFSQAVFSGDNVSFASARFCGGNVNFSRAVFSGGTVNFQQARFSDGQISFQEALFSGGNVDFQRAVFYGGTVTFQRAAFADGTVNFKFTEFFGGVVDFELAVFAGGTVNFQFAEFFSGTVNFGFAVFSKDMVIFNFAAFSGGVVNLRFAVFEGGAVEFMRPLNWSSPPVTQWSDGDESPPRCAPSKVASQTRPPVRPASHE